MFSFMELGGPVMWLLLLCGVFGLIVFLERAFHVHRARIRSEDFLKGICNILRRQNLAEAITICDETPGPVACLMRVAILHHDRDRDTIRRAMDEAALTEIGRLEQRFSLLATVAHTAPLLGMLGTVVGLIRVFLVVQEKAPLVHAGDLATGVWQALLTTAAGLVIAIPCYAGYNLLTSKVEALVLDMERSAEEILAFFTGSSTPVSEA